MVRDRNVWFAHETCGNVVQFSWLSDKQHNSNRWQTASFAIFTMSQIHYQNMPDAQISNPACFGASCTVLLCSVVFISFKNLRAAAPAADPGKKKRGSQCNPQSSQVRWMDVCPRLLDLCFCCSPSLLSVRIETLHLRPVRCSFISSTNWARVHPVWFPRYKTIAVLSCWYYL